MGWLRALAKDFILFCKLVQPLPSSLQSPLCASTIALAALAIARILTRHTCPHCQCPLCCHCHCSPATHVTVAIALPPSPSSSLATLIANAIPLITACHSHCRRHCPRCRLPSTHVAIAITLATITIAIVIACHPLCCLLCYGSTLVLIWEFCIFQ